ncbi:6-phosphogluconolactonase [Limnohabitans sp.]|uniref:6-phosphogluconolactonase n=1 Tax=Limnohabitans sp. TaxID=1907725 RepID=UPI0038B8891D
MTGQAEPSPPRPLAPWISEPRANITPHTGQADALTQALAHDMAQRLTAAIEARGVAVLGVSGGKSPVALFHALRVLPIAWGRVRITLADERCVPCTHADSNAHLVTTHLLQEQARAAHWVPMVSQAAEPLPPLSQLVQIAGAALQAAGTPDVMVMGMGADGHTASLFPDAPNLVDLLDPHNTQVCAGVTLAQPPLSAPYPRITQTLAQILRARHIVLPVSGADKLHTLRQAWQRRSNLHPVSHLLHQSHTPVSLWISS